MAFATAEDVATAQKKDLDAEDAATVTYLLDVATQMIRSYTGQTLDLVADDSARVWPFLNRVVLLPEVPVVSVASVTDNGTLVDADDYEWTPWGVLSARRWSGKSIVVVYDHGHSPIPDDIRGVCVDVAKRAFENPAGLQRDDLNTASQWLGLTEENKLTLNKFKPL